jgi:chromosome segregation ATPase
MKPIIESLKAVQKSISLTRTRKRLVRAKSHLESNVRGSLVELGRACYEANPDASRFEPLEIPALLRERDDIREKLQGHEAEYEKELCELKAREKEVEERLAACNRDKVDREGLLKGAEKDLKLSTARIKKYRNSILKSEKRKKRAMQYKTWIPAPLLSRKIEDLNQKIIAAEGEIREKQRKILPLKEELKQAVSKLDAVKMEWVRINQEITGRVRDKNRAHEHLEKIRDEIVEKLEDAYSRAGEIQENDAGAASPEFRPFLERVNQEREQLAGLLDQIRDFSEVLDDPEFVRKRRAGRLWILVFLCLVLAIAGSLVWFLFVR